MWPAQQRYHSEWLGFFGGGCCCFAFSALDCSNFCWISSRTDGRPAFLRRSASFVSASTCSCVRAICLRLVVSNDPPKASGLRRMVDDASPGRASLRGRPQMLRMSKRAWSLILRARLPASRAQLAVRAAMPRWRATPKRRARASPEIARSAFRSSAPMCQRFGRRSLGLALPIPSR